MSPALLQALDRYPYGCSEQLVSRALPLLYVNKLANLAAACHRHGRRRTRQDGDRRELLARQDSNGAFGLWAANDADDMWLHAYVTDFLTRAREQNYAVPQKAFDMALERLRNYVANTSEVEAGQAAPLAYAVYVLARNGRPVMSDLRYLADTKLAAFQQSAWRGRSSPRRSRCSATAAARRRSSPPPTQVSPAERDSLFSRADYGSRLRDGAGVLALAVEAERRSPPRSSSGPCTSSKLRKPAPATTSTQEDAWMVLAAEALADKAAAIDISVDGVERKGRLLSHVEAAALDGKTVKITNRQRDADKDRASRRRAIR